MAVFNESRRHICQSNYTFFSFHFWTFIVVFITSLNQSDAWDNTDLELFDLVEEVSQNFYEVLGLDQSASQGEIRKAYRRLSLQYHPDKNKEEGAEEKFRLLVAVAEVLRDEDKRKRYDDILLNGLPDWRQPVYYYRRVREMGLLEATTLLSIILTVGHYIVMWSMYWERKFELESLIKPKREKKNKKVTKSSEEPKPDAYAILEDPTFLPKPQITDSLPFKCYRLLKASIFFVITSCGSFYSALRQKFEKKPEEPVIISDEEDEGEEEKKPRERQKINPALYDYNRDVSVEHLTAMREALVKDDDREQEKTKVITKDAVWTQAEVKLLIKSIARFPGGTVDRWEKIAAEIGRPLNEVTKKAKEIKNKGYATAVDASVQGITGNENHTVVNRATGEVDASTISIASSPLEDQPITCEVASYDYFEDEEMSKKKRRHKGGKSSSKSANRTEMITGQNDHERTVKNINPEMESGNNLASECKSRDEHIGVGDEEGGINVEAQGNTTKQEAVEAIVFDGVESCSWTQRQQKILEKALQVYPKGTPERWDKIAGSVPGKNKEDCILRYKELVEVVRRKKMAAEK